MKNTPSSAGKTELIRSVKFTLFSMTAGLIQIGSFTLLRFITPLPYWPRYLIALVLSVVYNFTINRKLTFRSAANIPLAMAKVFGYYCVFTPFSTILGDYLVDVAGWNDFLVLIISMLLNFVTEFLFTRFIIYGKQVDNSKDYVEKHTDGAVAGKNGPAVSKTALLICAVCTVLAVAAIILVRVFGYSPSRLLTGRWVSYTDGVQVVYTFGDGTATFSDANGTQSVFDYSVENDSVILTGGERKVYRWTHDAVRLTADHSLPEIDRIMAEEGDKTGDFAGYIYVEGDYMYVGDLCMCREGKLDGFDSTSLEGSWTGCAGDLITFGADGGCHCRAYGLDDDGRYAVDGDTLSLTLGGDTTVLSDAEWGVSGRVLHIRNRCYFRNTKEE